MKFARIVFLFAGVWGITVVTPLFFLVDVTGRRYSPPSEYPQFFYGFLAVTIAWQIGFLVIGSDPQRFRPLMIPGIVEKMGYVSTLLLLYSQAVCRPRIFRRSSRTSRSGCSSSPRS